MSSSSSEIGHAAHAIDASIVATPYGVRTVTAQIMHQHPTFVADVAAPAPQPHGYSDRATGRALINDDAPKSSWRVSDDAPRYQPPGTVEKDQDPFGLGALPQHVVYNGPKDLPNDTTLGFLLGLLSFVFFPFAFFGLRCTRRGRKMIAAAPNRYRGKMLSVVALVSSARSVRSSSVRTTWGTYPSSKAETIAPQQCRFPFDRAPTPILWPSDLRRAHSFLDAPTPG
jgi:hypothetical protein